MGRSLAWGFRCRVRGSEKLLQQSLASFSNLQELGASRNSPQIRNRNSRYTVMLQTQLLSSSLSEEGAPGIIAEGRTAV